MKKRFAILLVLLLVLSLAACSPKEEVTIRNDLPTIIEAVYISPVADEEWGDPLNYARIKSGSSIGIAFEKFAGNSSRYDIGSIDENGMNYDFPDVPLAVGDILAISLDGEDAILSITGTDGKTDTYEGYAYSNDEMEE